MSGSIRLHREHGLNPTIAVCFWCGKDTGDLALLGASYQNEAPRRMVVDYEPCDTCRQQMLRGITLMEASEGPPPEPTGRWAVVTEAAVEKMFSPDAAADVIKHRKAFVHPDAYNALGLGQLPDTTTPTTAD